MVLLAFFLFELQSSYACFTWEMLLLFVDYIVHSTEDSRYASPMTDSGLSRHKKEAVNVNWLVRRVSER